MHTEPWFSEPGLFYYAPPNVRSKRDPVINIVLQIPKVRSQGTLLDSRNGGGDLGPACRAWILATAGRPANQSPADDTMKKKRMKEVGG